MNGADSLDVLEQYGLAILPALVVAEQFGIPLPAVPALLGVGARGENVRTAPAVTRPEVSEGAPRAPGGPGTRDQWARLLRG